MISSASAPSPFARLFKSLAAIEPDEIKAVALSLLYFFFLFGSYSVLKPVRDAMGTVYGMKHIQELFTGTFVASFVFAPLYSGLASRLKLSIFLPWVYGFVGVTLLIFYTLFVSPALATLLSTRIGNENLLLISAVGFSVTALLVHLLAREKQRLLSRGVEAQSTTLDHRLPGDPLDGFRLLLESRYLLLLALFLLLTTWISTIVYIQLGDLITKAFTDKAARTQAYALIDLTVNSLALGLQVFGTGRLIYRFGVTSGLLVNPVIMVIAFLAIAFSPVLLVLGGIQVIRRVAEYAVAKPAREMLFTVVDQESKYKAKNVIDTVVYRFGDLSAAWIGSFILPYSMRGLRSSG